MRNLVITICGTSLLTNPARPVPADLGIIGEFANKSDAEIPPEAEDCIRRYLDIGVLRLAGPDTAEIRKASAEINTLYGFYGGQFNAHAQDVHFLFHTDTYQGELVAQKLADRLRELGFNASTEKIAHLRTDKLENFQHGLAGIIRWCADNIPGYRQKGYHVVFNLTGGFKSIQGWMQTLGMFYADEILYIFESGGELLRIPRIPVNIEAAATDAVRHHLPFFRRMGRAGAFCPAGDKPDGLAETFLYRIGDEIELSPWGRLIWDQSKKMLYRENLLETPSDAIVYSEGFRQAAAQRTPDELHHVNERLDDFAAYLQDPNTNLNRLDPRGLRGNPLPPSTHEFNAWAQHPAWRVFYHDENGKKILDDLRPGLH